MLTVAVSEYTVFSYCSKLTAGVYSHSWHNCLQEKHIFIFLHIDFRRVVFARTIRFRHLIPPFMRACRIFLIVSEIFVLFCARICFSKFRFTFIYYFYCWCRLKTSGLLNVNCLVVFFSLHTFKVCILI